MKPSLGEKTIESMVTMLNSLGLLLARIKNITELLIKVAHHFAFLFVCEFTNPCPTYTQVLIKPLPHTHSMTQLPSQLHKYMYPPPTYRLPSHHSCIHTGTIKSLYNTPPPTRHLHFHISSHHSLTPTNTYT